MLLPASTLFDDEPTLAVSSNGVVVNAGFAPDESSLTKVNLVKVPEKIRPVGLIFQTELSYYLFLYFRILSPIAWLFLVSILMKASSSSEWR